MDLLMEDDLQAIRKLKQGDIGGLETLVARYQVKAARSAFLILRDRIKAEDITQQAFIQIFQHIRKFDEGRPFAPYLFRTILNASLDEIKKSARTVEISEDLAEFDGLLQRAITVEEAVENAELKHSIFLSLGRLNPQQRAAVVMRYYLEMSEQEMAEILNRPQGTIKWLLHKARQKLRSLLRNERSKL
jgi:RNA polymerase sigma-70 factor (ECF subfamily)